jgi:hypothetical protein
MTAENHNKVATMERSLVFKEEAAFVDNLTGKLPVELFSKFLANIHSFKLGLKGITNSG